MTPEQMQKNSAKKVQQVLDLLKVLNLRVEAKDRVDLKTGLIEKMVYWIDDENYPTPEAIKAPAVDVVPNETPA
jgi:hypothetical protein